MAKVVDAEDPMLIKRLAESRRLALVEFKSPWCSPCKDLERNILDFLEEYDCNDTIFIRVDMSRAPRAVAWFRVMNAPTLLLYREGRLVARVVKVLTPDEIAELLECSPRG